MGQAAPGGAPFLLSPLLVITYPQQGAGELMVVAARATINACRVVVHHLGLGAGVLDGQEDGTARLGVYRPVIVVLVVLHLSLEMVVPIYGDFDHFSLKLIAVYLIYSLSPFPKNAKGRATPTEKPWTQRAP